MSLPGNNDVRVRIEPASSRYGARDDAFVEQTEELWRELRRSGVQLEDAPSSGTKGSEWLQLAEVLIVGGAGLKALLDCVNRWIEGRSDRSVHLTVLDADGGKHAVVVDAHNVKDETLLAVTKEYLKDRD